MERFWKLTRPDGWDFYTGRTINYRENVGKTVVCPKFNKNGELCSSAFIHASRTPEHALLDGKIPCSVFRVEGIPVVEDGSRAGFHKLLVAHECEPEAIFKWKYREAVAPIHPLLIRPPQKITEEHIRWLKDWSNICDNIQESLLDRHWDFFWNVIGDNIWFCVGRSLKSAVKNSIGQDSVGSIWDVVHAYIGSLFIPIVNAWQDTYPFQSAVDLWKMGLVPSYDGKIWRLHGGNKAEILWKGKI